MADHDIFSGVHEVTIEPPEGVDDPGPGLVVRWRRRGDLWEALVSQEVDGRITTEWIPALKLAPNA